MTVATGKNVKIYAGNDATTVFAYDFRILDEDDLVVSEIDADGTVTVLTKTTDYTVSGVGLAAGGNVTVATATATGTNLVIRRSFSAFLQDLDLRNQGDFFLETIEDMLDKVVMYTQQLRTDAANSLRLLDDLSLYDAGGKKIAGLANATESDQAVAYGQINGQADAAADSAAAAAASAVTAEGHADDAEAAKLAAEAAAAGVSLPAITSSDHEKMLIVTPGPVYSLVKSSMPVAGYSIARRGGSGELKVGTPTDPSDAATKAYADALGDTAATANTIARRDANGRLQVATPSAAADAATKDYVDARQPGYVGSTGGTSVTTITGTWEIAGSPGDAGVYLSFDAAEVSGYYLVNFTSGSLNGGASDNKWYLLAPNLSGLSSKDYAITNSSVTAGILGINYIAPGDGAISDTGTFEAYKLSNTLKRGVTNIACNATGTELYANSSRNIEYVSGSAKTGSALLAVVPTTVTGAPRAFACKTAAGVATLPDSYSFIVV